ncbi:MAG TPA: flagellar protein FlbD [Firmicutes bacterium]|jgi:flagellar protein FlbD|nr:flagellar protein FlbD [Bacillota bacterium]
MITVHRLNGEEFLINPHLIEIIEAAPDTTISLVTGRKLIVKTPVPDIIAQIIEYRRLIGNRNFSEYEGTNKV